MSRSRTTEILESWRAAAHAAVLPEEAPRQPRSASSFGVAGIAFAVVILVALMWRGQTPGTGGIAAGNSASASTSTPTPSVDLTPPSPSPVVAGSPSPIPLPKAGGTCSASQFVLGTATSGYAFGPIGTTVVYVTQPLRNGGKSCDLALPETIGVVSGAGQLEPVEAGLSDTQSLTVRSGQSISLVLKASWPSGGSIAGSSTAPCSNSVSDVNGVVIPLASGVLQLDLNPVWREVCSSPPSVSLAIVK